MPQRRCFAEKGPARPGVGDHAARRPQASLAECRLARGRDGRARSAWHWRDRGIIPRARLLDPWVGDGTARAATSDIARALSLYKLACLIEGGLVLGPGSPPISAC